MRLLERWKSFPRCCRKRKTQGWNFERERLALGLEECKKERNARENELEREHQARKEEREVSQRIELEKVKPMLDILRTRNRLSFNFTVQ